jgi:hypothetical protein
MISNNYQIIQPILHLRFFERGRTRIFDIEDREFHNTILYHGNTFPLKKDLPDTWNKMLPDVDIGDLIYVRRRNEFVIIQPRIDYKFLVRPNSEKNSIEPVFPIDYWREISKKAPFRIWIPCRCSGREDVEVWRTNEMCLFMTMINPDDFLITYSAEGKIHFYSVEE